MFAAAHAANTVNVTAVATAAAEANAAVAGEDYGAANANADAAAIDFGGSGAELAGTPLWRNGTPDWAFEAWRALKAALASADQSWRVWTDWCDARIAGDSAQPPIEALEIARTKIPDEIWRRVDRRR